MGAERNVCEFLAAPPRPTHPAFPRRTPRRSGLGRRHTERFPQRFAAACRNCHERPCTFHHLRWRRKACFLCHHTPILRGPPILAPSACEEVADSCRDLLRMGLEREVARIEEMDYG